jgi:PA-IL-like protein
MSTYRRLAAAAALAVGMSLSGAVAFADTLMLRNGNRVFGQLVSVRNGVVEFEEERGSQRRLLRIDQDEVRAIEFDADTFDLPTTGPGRPRGMREREVDVSARTSWTDTGIAVKSGQTIYFTAEGEVRWGRDRRDGPEGENNSPRNPLRPIPSRPGAALIGRVGEDAPFFIGADQGPIRVRSSGTLFLGINDDYVEDNTGTFKVTVYH